MNKPNQIWQRAGKDLLDSLQSGPQGLTTKEAQQRLEKYGPNELQEGGKKSGFRIFLEQFADFLVIILIVAAVISAVLGDVESMVVILAVITMNAILGTVQTVKAEQSLNSLKQLSAPDAKVVRDGQLMQVPAREVTVGDEVIVEAGDLIPADGKLLTVASLKVDESALTGESLPRDAKAGDEVISGCINMTGLLKIRTTKEFGESTVSKILELVENSSSRKSKSENFISKFAKYYTPAVCYGALALAFIPPIVLLIMGKPAMWGDWIYRALTFLVISCPCALVISIPLSFFAGIGGASNQGILVKGSNYLETLAQTKYVVFDKTGTMTQGVFEVSGIHHNEMPDEKLLEYAALAECSSSHPISKSLQKAYGKPIDRNRVTDIEEISGNGVIAKVDGISVAARNTKLMNRLGIAYQDCHHVGTVVHMAIDGKYAGHILISDIIKLPFQNLTYTDKHFHKVRTGNGEKRNSRFSCHCLCQKCLTSSGRAYKQHAFRNPCAYFCIFLWRFQEIYHLYQIFLLLLQTCYLVKSNFLIIIRR